MRLSEICEDREELDESIKTALIATAIGLAAVFTATPAAAEQLQDQFPTVTMQQATQIKKLSDAAIKDEIANYKERHGLSANEQPDARAMKFIKAKAEERVTRYLQSAKSGSNTSTQTRTQQPTMSQQSEVRHSNNNNW